MTTTHCESPTPSAGKLDHRHTYLIRLLAMVPEENPAVTDEQLDDIAGSILAALDGESIDDSTTRVAAAMISGFRRGDDEAGADSTGTPDFSFRILTDPAINFAHGTSGEVQQLVSMIEGVDAILNRADGHGERLHAGDLGAVAMTLQSVRRILGEIEARAFNVWRSLIADARKAVAVA